MEVFVCKKPNCKFFGFHQNSLNRHMISHSDPQARRAKLQRLARQQLEMKEGVSSGEIRRVPFEPRSHCFCRICGIVFGTRKDLNLHITQIHARSKFRPAQQVTPDSKQSERENSGNESAEQSHSDNDSSHPNAEINPQATVTVKMEYNIFEGYESMSSRAKKRPSSLICYPVKIKEEVTVKIKEEETVVFQNYNKRPRFVFKDEEEGN